MVDVSPASRSRGWGAENAARDALMTLLRQEAGYVQGASLNDLATLLSSGFNNISTNRAQTQLTAPGISRHSASSCPSPI